MTSRPGAANHDTGVAAARNIRRGCSRACRGGEVMPEGLFSGRRAWPERSCCMRSRGLAGEAGLIVVRRSVVVARALCTPTPCLDPSCRCSGKTGFRASLLPGRLLPPLLCTAVTAGGSCFPGARTLFGWPDSEGKHHLHEHYSFLGYTVHVTVNSVYSQTPADREAGNGRTAGGRHGHALAVVQPPGRRARRPARPVRGSSGTATARRTARPAPRPPWWPGAGGDGRELPGLRQDEDARPCAAFPWSSSCTA